MILFRITDMYESDTRFFVYKLKNIYFVSKLFSFYLMEKLLNTWSAFKKNVKKIVLIDNRFMM